ncbi:hypothetical protein ASPZODRAFT_133735 [Penicilliopsis zonata CBS 506.65]|uniref:Uncharacterized protein n=1 Tax=Penicilliopsis zonata CBS 506.65 TaxID=1073090 RepID=A0A1L9SF18_9EURO|nr:hypothetical protein ASPZODRAFT_133735 [Penicilliopsis zonata CBS 506.65]OJJ45865.1 hypothetical protein ASPZODRAFT_133735 [Penicilliopsis zonata CBS 506.65]
MSYGRGADRQLEGRNLPGESPDGKSQASGTDRTGGSFLLPSPPQSITVKPPTKEKNTQVSPSIAAGGCSGPCFEGVGCLSR